MHLWGESLDYGVGSQIDNRKAIGGQVGDVEEVIGAAGEGGQAEGLVADRDRGGREAG